MLKQDKRLQRWYEKYNKLYFGSKLPKACVVGWNNELDPGDAAAVHGVHFTMAEDGVDWDVVGIHLDAAKHAGAKDARMSLLHEMAHLSLYPYRFHGKKFDMEMRRLAMLGAFDGLW